MKSRMNKGEPLLLLLLVKRNIDIPIGSILSTPSPRCRIRTTHPPRIFVMA
jgi:hypothetical protein